MVRASTGMAVTVTVADAVAGVAKSPPSERAAVVVCAPGTAVEAMSTVAVIGTREDVAVAVHVSVRADPEMVQDQPLTRGAEANVSPDGSVDTSVG